MGVGGFRGFKRFREFRAFCAGFLWVNSRVWGLDFFVRVPLRLDFERFGVSIFLGFRVFGLWAGGGRAVFGYGFRGVPGTG